MEGNQERLFYEIYDTKLLGSLTIICLQEAVLEIRFGGQPIPGGIREETWLVKKAGMEVGEYLEGARKDFDLPLRLQGTVFQKKVWKALGAIPYGETRSYQEVARQVGCPKGCRAVGMANHRNPLPLVIPCHRVLGADGTLVGYGGGLDIKAALLDLEGAKYKKAWRFHARQAL